MSLERCNTKTTFDVILGDFGRLASVDYVRFLSEEEQLRISEERNSKFFDEERRIMFNLCCQIEWYKRDSISSLVARYGYVDRNILIGIGPDDVAQEFVRRGAQTIGANLDFAIKRGFERIRIYIPCNGLSDIIKEIAALGVTACVNEECGDKIRSTGQCVLANGTSIVCSTVVQKVVQRICRHNRSPSILVLGTEGVNDLYRSEVVGTGKSIYELNDQDYKLLDDAIVASIGKDQGKLRSIKSDLQEKIISRFRFEHKSGTIVEGCTDYNFNLGENSLRIFAEEMVTDAYRD